MKEHPILFSAPMVRALLDGTKTQTRRIVKPQPSQSSDHAFIGMDGIWRFSHPTLRGPVSHEADDVRCPYGQVGDQLWVREAWRIGAWNEDEETIAVDYLADGFCRKEWLDVPLDERSMFDRLWIQSTDDAVAAGLKTDPDGKYHWSAGQSPCRKRPSIHMPRWASRIQLEITGVSVERLQDISESDAIAEGINGLNYHGQFWRDYSLSDEDASTNPMLESAIESYRTLWESINGAGSWVANPWVWVLEFNGKFLLAKQEEKA